jgi:spherulation-specific family 4 protein
MKKSFIIILLLFVLSFVAIIAIVKTVTVTAIKETTGVIVPLYVKPDSPYWDTAITIKKDHPRVPIIVIINPHNGPRVNNTTIQSYLAIIQKLQSVGILVLGYTPTHRALTDSNEVVTDINLYKVEYHVNGILFDEMPTSPGKEGYFKNLNGYAKSQNLTFTVGNPGANVSRSYLGILDNLIIYENVGLPTLNYLASWQSKDDKTNFSITAYGVDSLDRSFLINARKYVNYIYITNDNLPNPWDTLPPYFNDLVGALDQ